jgi:hypothetical protein
MVDTDKNQEIYKEPPFRSKASRTLDAYIKDRVERKINIYFKKAQRSKKWHLIVSIIIAVSAALVPVLVNLKIDRVNFDFRLTATIFSLLVSIGVAIQEIFRFREHWRNYNLIESNLRSEEFLFSTSAGPYEKINDEKGKFSRFVQRIEELIKEERWDTIHMRTSASAVTEDERQQIEEMVKEFMNKK